MTLARDGLIGCITRWLPVLDEAELRAVEGFVLELVIESRERAIDSSTRAAGGNADRLPRVAARVDTSSVERGLAELADNAPDDDTWERRRWDVSDTGGES